MRIIILATSYLIISLQLLSQAPLSSSPVGGGINDIGTNSILALNNFGLSYAVKYDEIEGSPFFHNEFVLSSGLRANGELMDSIFLKYDLYSYNFLARLQDGEVIAVDTKRFREFRMNIDGEEILFKRVDPRNPNRFYEIIYEGKDLTIYKSEDIGLVDGKNSGISKTNDRFMSKNKFLIRMGKKIERVKLKKKVLWKYFDDNQREILEAYLKENKTKLKNARDYRKLFSILN